MKSEDRSILPPFLPAVCDYIKLSGYHETTEQAQDSKILSSRVCSLKRFNV